MSEKDSNINKMVYGLRVYIMEHDSFRPPVIVGVNHYSLGLSFKQNERNYFVKNNINLHTKIRKELYPYFKIYYKNLNQYVELNLRYSVRYRSNLHRMIKKDSDSVLNKDVVCKDHSLPILVPFNYYIILGLVVIGMSFIILDLYGFNFYTVLFCIFMSLIILYSFLAGISTKIRRIAGEKYDDDIKSAVHELIDYGTEMIIENDLNPEDFPIKLRHNDYNGLKYEMKGKNNYIGFFEINNKIREVK